MVVQVESGPNEVEGGQEEVYSQVDTLGARYESDGLYTYSRHTRPKYI